MRNAPAFLLRQFCLGKDATVAQLNLLRATLAAVPLQALSQRLNSRGNDEDFGFRGNACARSDSYAA
jgi:hypothetical protein